MQINAGSRERAETTVSGCMEVGQRKEKGDSACGIPGGLCRKHATWLGMGKLSTVF